MRIGNFEVSEPVPRLKSPHALAILKPWTNCGSVGSMALERLEIELGAKNLACLAQPGNFYDFTRYRPTIRNKGSVRELTIPNTNINWARGNKKNDFIFMHLLEPHMIGEVYANSVWQVLKKFGVKRYCLLGSFYDMVPHTKPILVSGYASNKSLQEDFEKSGILQNNYEGPVTICHLISQEAEKAGIETILLMVHLPQYTELEEDYMGTLALLKVLNSLYDVPVYDADFRKADDQARILEVAIQKNRKLKTLVSQLEAEYDTSAASRSVHKEPHLSPAVSDFLKQMEDKFRDSLG